MERLKEDLSRWGREVFGNTYKKVKKLKRKIVGT